MAASTGKSGIARRRASAAAAVLLVPPTEAELRVERRERRSRIINNAIELARVDEKARLALLAKLRLLGKGKRGRRTKDGVDPRIRHQEVATMMELLSAYAPTKSKSKQWKIERIAELLELDYELVERHVYPRRR
jgi:hypothetical protein